MTEPGGTRRPGALGKNHPSASEANIPENKQPIIKFHAAPRKNLPLRFFEQISTCVKNSTKEGEAPAELMLSFWARAWPMRTRFRPSLEPLIVICTLPNNGPERSLALRVGNQGVIFE